MQQTQVATGNSTRYKEKYFYCEGCQTLEQLAQKGWGSQALDVFTTQMDTALSTLLYLDWLLDNP